MSDVREKRKDWLRSYTDEQLRGILDEPVVVPLDIEIHEIAQELLDEREV